MPVLTLYRHGGTGGCPPSNSVQVKHERGDCSGWSDKSTRSNRLFLYSVDERQLQDSGWALSLTLRDCPDSSDDWHRIRNAFIRRLRRLGMVRLHWLTEWQRRGCPHLHAAVWFAPGVHPGAILSAWLGVAGAFGAQPQSQHVTPISDAVGWFQYLSKHAVRGLKHYQRSASSIPAGWQKTGRMWGRWGSWATVEGIRISVDLPGYHRYRRIVRSWRIADARASGCPRRIRSARRMLHCTRPGLSAVRGVAEWLGIEDQLNILDCLASLGHSVRNEEEEKEEREHRKLSMLHPNVSRGTSTWYPGDSIHIEATS